MPNPAAHAAFLCSWILVLEMSVYYRKKSLSLKPDFLQDLCISSPDLYCKLTELRKLHFGYLNLLTFPLGREDRDESI